MLFTQTSDTQSSLFSVLLVLSLLQTPDRAPGEGEIYSDAFVPFVEACSKSRVWKVRGVSCLLLTMLFFPNLTHLLDPRSSWRHLLCFDFTF
jgi:hypothetical protein